MVSLADWYAIDGAEVERGSTVGKPREKFTRLGDMFSVLSDQDELGRLDSQNAQSSEPAVQD